MNKRIRNLVICGVVLVCLGTLYAFMPKASQEGPPDPALEDTAETTSDPALVLTHSAPEDVATIIVSNDSGVYTLLPLTGGNDDEDITWYLSEVPELNLNQPLIRGLVNSVTNFTPLEKLTDDAASLAEYGLHPGATITIEYTGGGSDILIAGNMSPDNNYYYCTMEGSSAVYMVAEYTGNRFYYTYNDFIDKSLNKPDRTDIQSLKILGEDFSGISLGLGIPHGPENATRTDASLVMHYPYEGREIYREQLDAGPLSEYDSLAISRLVELSGDSRLDAYGLDSPSLEVLIASQEDSLHFYLGDREGDEVYFMLADSPHVFSVPYGAVAPLYNVDVFNMMQPFVALVDITFVTDIEIHTPDETYGMSLNHNNLDSGGNETERDYIYPVLNGFETDETEFRNAYQSLIGLTYDGAIDAFEPMGGPVITIIFHLEIPEDAINSAHPAIAAGVYDAVAGVYRFTITEDYYDYQGQGQGNENFYGVRRDGGEIHFVVNKRSVQQAIDGFDAMER